jgi:hypothetical protein
LYAETKSSSACSADESLPDVAKKKAVRRRRSEMRDNPLFTPESGHEMAIRDLRDPECRFGAKNIRFAPKKRILDDGVGMSAKGQ